MDKKVMAILVGTCCFGLGIGTGMGVMTLQERFEPTLVETTQHDPMNQTTQIDDATYNTNLETGNQTTQDKEDQKDSVEGVNKEDNKEENSKEVLESSKEEVLATAQTVWSKDTAYGVGKEVVHEGIVYQCIQAHTALEGWEPEKTPALWAPVQE